MALLDLSRRPRAGWPGRAGGGGARAIANWARGRVAGLAPVGAGIVSSASSAEIRFRIHEFRAIGIRAA